MTAFRDDIRVRAPAGEFGAYLALPEAANGVAVVVLQEIFGVNANIRAICDGFACAGYSCVAPDLFWRQAPGLQLDPGTAEGREQAVELMKKLDRGQAVEDAVAALAAVRALAPGLNKSAAVGYCFGGGVAYLLAARGLVDAGIAYYGTYIHTMLDEAAGLQSQLLLHIAGDDHLCPPDAQTAIKAALAPLGERAAVMIHGSVGHAFARRGGSTFNEPAAGRADAATMQRLATLIDAT